MTVNSTKATTAKRRVLLTGATGFIGTHCIAPLLARGFEIVATYRAKEPPPRHGVRWLHADLLKRDSLELVIAEAGASHLLHLAWYVEPGQLISHPLNVAWCNASMELLQTFHLHGGSRCVIGGSCYEYDWRHGYCNELLTPRQPDTLYGAAKLALSEISMRYSESVGLSAAWGRMFFLYGPGEHPRRLVPSVVLSLLAGEHAKCSHGLQIRDYAYVQDVADGMVALLDSSVSGAYNIATGQAPTVLSIVQALGQFTGRAELLRIGEIPPRANDAPLVVADVSAARRDLGWQATTSLLDGLRATVQWWQSRLATQASTQ